MEPNASQSLKEVKIGEQSPILLGLLLSFIGLFATILMVSLPAYNLWVKLVINAAIIILFFIFLVKQLSKQEENKNFLIIMNQNGFYYQMKLVCTWNELNKVSTEKRFKVSNGIGSEDHYLLIGLTNKRKLDFKISVLDADVEDLKKQMLMFREQYGNA